MTALGDYLTDTLKLGPTVAARIEASEPYRDTGTGAACLMPHSFVGEGAERRCSSCGLTYAESAGRPFGGHLACLARAVRGNGH
jgi:hypothetical protein